MQIKNKISGMSLIEVLITILVMAIGMLGIAVLQIKTLNTSQASYSRAQAIAMVEDVSDKMRANYEFIHSDLAGNNSYVSASADGWCEAPPTACTSSCSQEALALNDIVSSCTALTNTGIPSAKLGALCMDNDGADADTCSPGSSYIIYSAWSPDARADTDGSADYNEATFCQDPIGLAATETCVYVELVP